MPPWPRLVTAAATAVVALGLVPGCTVRRLSPGIETMVTHEIRPVQDQVTPQEEIYLRVKITNQGREEAELPDPTKVCEQPVYTLEGPAYPKGRTFSMASLYGEASPAVPLIRVGPGETWEGVVPLEARLQLHVPGEYRLTSRLLWGEVQSDSPPCSFRVSQPVLVSIHGGFGSRPPERGEGTLAAILQETGSDQLFTFSFIETRPDLGEAKLGSPIRRGSAGSGSSDVGVPWRNTPFFDELINWIVWRQGRRISALSDIGKTVSFELPAEPAFLVQPPLKTKGGPVEVLAASNDGKEISLVRFPSDPPRVNDPGEPAKLAWKAPLPAEPKGMTAALGPVSQGSQRHVAFAVPSASGLEIFHASYSEDGGLGPFQSVKVEAARLLAGASPALFVDKDGNVFISVLATTDDKGLAGALVEARFSPEGKPAGPARLLNFGTLPAKPLGGALLYVDKHGVLARLEAVVTLEGNRLLRLNASGQMLPVSNPGRPTHPIVLLPGQHVSYIVYDDPVRGLYVEALN
jgi:hypothetical protein